MVAVCRGSGAFFLLAVALFGALPSLRAQVSIEPRAHRKPSVAPSLSDRIPDLRVDAPLVMIPVQVTTPFGATVTGLQKENFRVFEDGVEQTITQFGREDAPVAVGFLLDTSGSMRNKIQKSISAAGAFLRAANLDDEFLLIRFGERPKLAVPMTRNLEQVRLQLARTKPMGRTSLLDAIHLSLSEMKRATNIRKAIVILSDGGDNHSRYTESEIKRLVHEADVQVYAIGIFDEDQSFKTAVEERNGPRLLAELAEDTGGKHFPVREIKDLPAVCERLDRELRTQYMLGYSPSKAPRDGTYRHVAVTLSGPTALSRLHVRHRVGYAAPLD